MTCEELIERLEKFPKDTRVVVSSDDEGNTFRFLLDECVTIEKFDDDLEIYAKEDYHDELKDYMCIG